MTYKPKDFTVEACGYYDALYGRYRNPRCIPEAKRWRYHSGYNQGAKARDEMDRRKRMTL